MPARGCSIWPAFGRPEHGSAGGYPDEVAKQHSTAGRVLRLIAALPFLGFVLLEYHWAHANGVEYLFNGGLFATVVGGLITIGLLVWAVYPYLARLRGQRDGAAAATAANIALAEVVALVVVGFGAYSGATMFLYGVHVQQAKTDAAYAHVVGTVDEYGGIDFELDGQTYTDLQLTPTDVVTQACPYVDGWRLCTDVDPSIDNPTDGGEVNLAVDPNDPNDIAKPFWVAGFPYHVINANETVWPWMVFGPILFVFCGGWFVVLAIALVIGLTGRRRPAR